MTDGVWAVGDVTGRGAFTHVAMYQSEIATADILGDRTPPPTTRRVPRVTFTDPEVGSVGLTAQAARDAGIDVAVGRADVPSTARGWLHKTGNDGFIQLVADRRRGVLVGATSMGPNGGEVLGLLTLAVHARTPIDELRSMIYAYPTFHRGVEDALRDLRMTTDHGSARATAPRRRPRRSRPAVPWRFSDHRGRPLRARAASPPRLTALPGTRDRRARPPRPAR